MEIKILNKSFECEEVLKCPIKAINDKSTRELFDLFVTLLPDHPTEDNTFLYFLKQVDRVDVVWVCEHFEGSCPLEMSGLSHFLQEMQWHFGEAEIHVELLDGFWEKLMIQVYYAPFDYPRGPEDVKNKNVMYGDLEEATNNG